jgi:hypothetical protein
MSTTMSPAQKQIWEEMQRNGAAPEVPVIPAVPAIVPVEPTTLETDPTGVVARTSAPAAPAEPAEPVAPAESPEKRYEYFLKDDQGRPMGGKQVIVYRTDEEFRDKLIKNQENAVRQLRKVTREKELGAEIEESDDVEKFQKRVEFKPRTLSADENFQLAQKLTNPETAAEARDLLIESAFGATSSVVADTLNEATEFMIQQRAVENYFNFVNSGTDYYDSPANRSTITSWMMKKKYAPTVANFSIAFQRLTQAGLLEVTPEVHQENVSKWPPAAVVPPVPAVPVEQGPNPQVPVATPSGLTAEQPQAKRHSHVPSGLNPSVASSAGESPVAGPNVTLADIDKLPADVYKAKMKDPAFRKLVDQLEEDAAKKRRARQIGQV